MRSTEGGLPFENRIQRELEQQDKIMIAPVRRAVSTIEGTLDRIKLGYKWRFDRWEHLSIQPYRGYVNDRKVFLKGRVLDDHNVEVDADHDSVWRSISTTIRRIETDEIPGALVRLDVFGRVIDIETDGDGFFDAAIDLESDLSGGWHDVGVELLAPSPGEDGPVRADVPVFRPYDGTSFGIISDLDDTVIRTGATNKLRMIRTVLLNSAHTRSPFPGVAALYRALVAGPDGTQRNPIFYVSSSPWNFYDMFETFMDVRDIPQGPIFLKDFGFTDEQFFNTGHEDHKLDRIDRLMHAYPDLPFILIGDSGQEDPEIYLKVVQRFGKRIKAVYIRDVTDDRRDAVVDGIAEQVRELGVPMIRTEGSAEAAVHAAEIGLISEAAGLDVQERMREEMQAA